MATEWFYARNGRQYGPLSSRKIRRLALRGDLQPTDLLWKEGMDQWRPAGESPKLFGLPGGRKRRRPPAAPAANPSAAPTVAAATEHDDGDPGVLARLPLGKRPLLAAIVAGVALGIAAVAVATVVLIGIDRMSMDQVPDGIDAPVAATAASDATGSPPPPEPPTPEVPAEAATADPVAATSAAETTAAEPAAVAAADTATPAAAEPEPSPPPEVAEQATAAPVGRKKDDDF